MHIHWSARAVRHLVSLQSFVAADDPPAAQRVAIRIERAVALLQEQPGLGRPGRVPGTRELVISGTPYIVAYTAPKGETVEILAVYHGKQKWPESLQSAEHSPGGRSRP